MKVDLDVGSILSKLTSLAVISAVTWTINTGWEIVTFMDQAKRRWAVQDAQVTGLKRYYRTRENISLDELNNDYFRKEQRLRRELGVPDPDELAEDLES